jgi:FkbM family methyltransferase
LTASLECLRHDTQHVFQHDDLLTTDKKIVFYGAGRYAREFTRRHCVESRNLRLPDYVCDRATGKWGSEFFGAEVCSPERLFKEAVDDVIVIVTTCPFFVLGDVRDQLYYHNFLPAASLEMRFCLAEQSIAEVNRLRGSFADDKSRRVFDSMTRGQADGQVWFRDIYDSHPYFENDVVSCLPDGEVLVDAGAYTGEHIAAFGRANRNFRAAYAFEPFAPHLQAIAGRFAGDSRVKPIGKGLYSANMSLAFDDEIPLGAHVVSPTGRTDEKVIDVVRLDDEVDDGVTYIKMDIEGAELDALAGCAETIRRNRPRLAICVYHRPSDYFEIPRLVHAMRPDYRLFLRQHSPFNIDTVLYAV